MPRLTGEVLDRFTGEGIGGALIRVNGYVTHSDESGFFSIDVPSGTYTVNVSATGYDPNIRTVSITEDTYITVLLTPIAHVLR